ncbi:carbonic anhydrase 2-like [Stylophora pistillata]|uniref:carbonic anhydrase 2-like n=1 Tax=Stylophora pistillata TaxID=50429 RepID=UPI000C056C1F|nr:carbonic anhydrase 2-like [Stylophora pistillata]
MLAATVLLGLVTVSVASEGAKWKYGETDSHGYGPPDWGKVSKYCDFTAQSPIDIETASIKKDANLKELRFTADNENGKVSGVIKNNGHAPTLAINKLKGKASLTGGPLGDSVYMLQQFHFHFGCDESEGSEHLVNGKAYPGELHLVTYNTKYSDFDTAASRSDGLAVIGVFFEKKKKGEKGQGKKQYKAVRKLHSALRKLENVGDETSVKNIKLFDLVPELTDLSSFYSYKGSLTTPPCYQSVSWIVLKEPIKFHKSAFGAMRKLKNGVGGLMCGNFRPPQTLNGRVVSEFDR